MRHSTVMLLLTVAFMLTALWPVGGQTSCAADGMIQRETYGSARLGQTMFYTAHLPPCYDENRAEPYPLVLLMHGSNEDDGQWGRLGWYTAVDAAVQSGEIEPFVTVMPFGNVIANRNRFDSASWSAIVMNELLPTVQDRYHIRTDGAGRAIGGISRGGFWAYHLAFRYPDQFARVGGHSPFFDLYHAPPEENPLDLAQTASALNTLNLWLDHGVDDYAAPAIQIMHERLTERGITHTYTINPVGEHNNAYWSQHLDAYLAFYSEIAAPAAPAPTAAPASAFVTNTPAAPITTVTPVPRTDETLLLPVAAFGSLQTTVTSADLQRIVSGDLQPALILDMSSAASLNRRGITLHPQTRIVEDDALRAALWRDPMTFSLLPLDRLRVDLRVLFVDDLPVTEQLARYPFAGEDAAAWTRITLSGVTALARQTRTALDQNGLAWATEALRPYAQAADIFHISSEVSFVDGCPQHNRDTLGGASSFCANPDHAALFTMLGADVIELSGNHNNDYGYEAYRTTFEGLQQAGLQSVGGGLDEVAARRPLHLQTAGGTIGWLACNAIGPYYALANDDPDLLGGVRPGAAFCDWDWLSGALPQLASEVDVVIVSVQYQEVEDYQPLPQQQTDFRRLADLGADIVVGTQAHKPQTYEFYEAQGGRTVLLHYGMGNLYFDQPFWGNSRFFLNTLYLSEGRLRAIEIFPGIIEDLGRPRLMTAAERENFLFFMFREQNGF